MVFSLVKSGVLACAYVMLLSSTCYAIELSILNELKEYESGNLLRIENGRSAESPRNRFDINIHPGKKVQVTKGNVRKFTLVRKFVRHKLKYDISCPPPGEEIEEATVTLLQVHRNILPAGCRIERRGHWSKRGGMKWQTDTALIKRKPTAKLP